MRSPLLELQSLQRPFCNNNYVKSFKKFSREVLAVALFSSNTFQANYKLGFRKKGCSNVLACLQEIIEMSDRDFESCVAKSCFVYSTMTFDQLASIT